MICQWNKLLEILPAWLLEEIDPIHKSDLIEIRLRLNKPTELITHSSVYHLRRAVTPNDIDCCINHASKYSPWAAASISKGYITIEGGHRLGLCGTAFYKGDELAGIRDISSICIRIARDYPGISKRIEDILGSTLILGAPGWGKTTLLRDLSRRIAENYSLSVVDERGELFPAGFLQGKRMDVLVGAEKADGMAMVLRTMGPWYIAVDEITHAKDTEAILCIHGCGVKLLATAHAGSLAEFYERPTYRPIVQANVFDRVVILHPDRSYTVVKGGTSCSKS